MKCALPRRRRPHWWPGFSAGAEEPAAPPQYPPVLGTREGHRRQVAVVTLLQRSIPCRILVAGDPGASELKIPIAGPWLALAKNGCAADDRTAARRCTFARRSPPSVGSRSSPAWGSSARIFMTTEARSAQPNPAALTVQPAPVIAATGMGLGVVGTF